MPARNRRGLGHQTVGLEVRPQSVRDVALHQPDILLEMVDGFATEQDRLHRGMPEGKLQRSRLNRHPVPGTDLVQRSHSCLDLGRSFLILVRRTLSWAGREDTGIEYPARENGDAGHAGRREPHLRRRDPNVRLPIHDRAGYALVGMNAADSREITITLPEDFPVGELAGKQNTPDRVLQRLSILVKSLGKASNDGEKNYLLCELYFSTKYWMRNVAPTVQEKPTSRSRPHSSQ